jgi:2-iminoacetate synthase ThiH
MKMTIEVDCTPEEARRFMGLPDVTGLNDKLVEEMGKRIEANINLLSPEEFMKNWMAFGAGAQEQFRKLMEAGLNTGMGGTAPKG